MKIESEAREWQKLARLKRAASRIAKQIAIQEQTLGFAELKDAVSVFPAGWSDIAYTNTGVAVAKLARVFVKAEEKPRPARTDSRISVL